MKTDLLRELSGGVYLWRGRPWWFVLPDDWKIAQPRLLSGLLMTNTLMKPEKLAALLGAERYFPLTKAKRGQWSLELRRRGLSEELLPKIDARLALAKQLPFESIGQNLELVDFIWVFLAPLVGRETALNCLRTTLIPWSLWQERRPWHETGRRTLLQLLGAKKYALRTFWRRSMPAERIELFLGYLGPGRHQPDVLLEAAQKSCMNEAVNEMIEIWVGPTTPPEWSDGVEYLTLALTYPNYSFPRSPFHANNLGRLLSLPEPVSASKLDLLTELGQLQVLPVESIVRSELSNDDIRFVLEHDLEEALYGSVNHARKYLELCRLLIDAGLPAELLKDEELFRRSSNRHIFCYLLLSSFEKPWSKEQAAKLERLAPGVGIAKDWQLLPDLSDDLEEQTLYLAELLELPLYGFREFVRLRLALGKEPLSRRFRGWCPVQIEKQRDYILKRLEAAPDDPSISRQLERLGTEKPDKNEKKRCLKEIKKGRECLPGQLWQAHIMRISESLLKSILGSDVLESAPRVAFFLKNTDLPVDKLLLFRSQHPSNQKWLQRFERNGFLAAYWLDGLKADIQLEEKFIELRTETRPSEILEMGTHFGTCLNLEDGENAFSVLTNLLEVNKMVLLGRDLSGQVVIRKLLGLTLKGELVGYHTYSHLSGAKGPVDAACHDFARKCGLKLSNTATPERIMHDLHWYDDGLERWAPGQSSVAEGWPQDQAATRQRLTGLLAEGAEPRGFFPMRPVEVYHYLKHERFRRPRLQDTGSWAWTEALKTLTIGERFGLLTKPRYHNAPAYMLPILSECAGITRDSADEYAALLNPRHRLYKRAPIYPGTYESVSLSAAAVFASPKVLRKTIQGLGEINEFKVQGQFLNELTEIVSLSLAMHPNDQGWYRFYSPGTESLLVGVGHRRAVPQWAGAFKKITEKFPDWDGAWLARARAEGPRLLPLLRHKLKYNRRSLAIACAIHLLGEDPEEYILPRPERLCCPRFLNSARPLRALIKRRLARLERRGYHPDQIRGARSSLKDVDPADWSFWPDMLRDDALDFELTREVLVENDYSRAGAWVRLGSFWLRLELLRHLKADLTKLQKVTLSQLEPGDTGNTRDRLSKLWIYPKAEFSWRSEQARQILLCWDRYPKELEALLSRMVPSKRAYFLSCGAEWVSPAVLKQLVELAFPKADIPFSALGELAETENTPVVLLELLLAKVEGELPEALAETERGRWCLEKWRS
jgi:hypothetical protein